MNSLPTLVERRPSAALLSVLETPVAYGFQNLERQTGPMVERKQPWVAPALADDSLRKDACRLWEWTAGALQPVERSIALRWLVWLGGKTASNSRLSEDEAELEAKKVLPEVMNFPVGCFTERTITAALDRFQAWFPEAGPLRKFLGEIEDEIRTAARRSEIIMGLPSPSETFGAAWTCAKEALKGREREIAEQLWVEAVDGGKVTLGAPTVTVRDAVSEAIQDALLDALMEVGAPVKEVSVIRCIQSQQSLAAARIDARVGLKPKRTPRKVQPETPKPKRGGGLKPLGKSLPDVPGAK